MKLGLKKPIKIHKLWLLLIFIVFIGLLVVTSSTYKFLESTVDLDQQQKGEESDLLTTENFLAGAPSDALTVNEALTCQQARPQYTTIKCDTHEEGEAISVIRGEGDWSSSESVKNFPVELTSETGTVKLESTLQMPNTFWGVNKIQITDENDNFVCSSSISCALGIVFGCDYDYGCENVVLQTGKRYRIVSDEPNQGITMFGARKYLYATNSDWGGVPIQIPQTANCVYQNWLSNYKELIEERDGVKNIEIGTDSIGLSTKTREELDESDINAITGELSSESGGEIDSVTGLKNPILEQPTFFTEGPDGRVALKKGDSWFVNYAYVEKANIYTSEYKGLAVTCDPISRTLYGFKKVSLGEKSDGSEACYSIPQPGYVFLSQEKLPEDEVFCCNTNDCVGMGLSTNYRCQDYVCVKNGNDTTGCISDSECTSEYWTNGDGQDVYLKGKCVIPTAKTYGTCNFTSINIECNPERTYPNDMCCNGDLTRGFKLEPCQQSIRSCRETFGENACCLETQNYYTIQQCNGDLQCCGASSDGIGNCMASCEPPTILERLKSWLKDTFKVDEQTAKILMWIAIIIAILLLLYFLGPIIASIFKIGGMRPPRFFGGSNAGFGGSRGVGGGGNIIIIK